MEENAKLVEYVTVWPPLAVLLAQGIPVTPTLAVRVGPVGLVGSAPASLDSVERHVKQVRVCNEDCGAQDEQNTAKFSV